MSDDNLKVTADDSRLALRSIRDAQTKVREAARGPIWLTVLTTFLVAVMLLGMWVYNANLAAVGSVLILCSVWLVYIAALRRKGLIFRSFPSSSAGKWFLAAQALFIFSVNYGTNWLLDHGYAWAGWVGTLVLCTYIAITIRGIRIKSA